MSIIIIIINSITHNRSGNIHLVRGDSSALDVKHRLAHPPTLLLLTFCQLSHHNHSLLHQRLLHVYYSSPLQLIIYIASSAGLSVLVPFAGHFRRLLPHLKRPVVFETITKASPPTFARTARYLSIFWAFLFHTLFGLPATFAQKSGSAVQPRVTPESFGLCPKGPSAWVPLSINFSVRISKTNLMFTRNTAE